MSNLSAAREAIEAELEHAREGAAYYTARVAALEDALNKIKSMEAGGTPDTRTTSTLLRPNQSQAWLDNTEQGQARSPHAELPPTNKQFWLNLLTSEPQSTRDLLVAATKSLGIEPTKEQRKKLTLRLNIALHNLVKAKEISDSGTGRERRFFRSR